MNPDSPIILAVDTNDLNAAASLITKTQASVGVYKLGLEFYLAHGKTGIDFLRNACGDFKIFLDLKLHDIPNTVTKACASVAPLRPTILTVHAAGGSEMIKGAARALPDTRIAAVTVLTSLSQEEVDALGFAASIPNLVNSLAHRSVDSGATAIVCSPWEVSTLRASLPSEISLITPGVRPHNSGTDDQSRTMTPFEAHKAGADFLVIGRPITAASDPGEAAASILATLV